MNDPFCFSHAFFKKRLVDHFRRRNEQLEQRERYMTETYARMMATWSKKVERMENSKKRREREAKARELYEKIFPELRKQREDKVWFIRFHQTQLGRNSKMGPKPELKFAKLDYRTVCRSATTASAPEGPSGRRPTWRT